MTAAADILAARLSGFLSQTRMRFISGLRALADVAFGPCCIHCGGLLEGAQFDSLCEACAGMLARVSSPACRTCGHPFDGIVAGEHRCCHCERLEPVFGEGRTAILLRGPGRTLVHQFKYRNGGLVRRDVRRVLADMPRLEDYVSGAVLVPVPLHPRKLRERGYNQSLWLAQEVRAVVPACEVRELLRRVRDTPTQTRLDREARATNLKNAFAMTVADGFVPPPRCVLVDDVFTTGSTLNACASVLLRSGCARVDVLTLGHG